MKLSVSYIDGQFFCVDVPECGTIDSLRTEIAARINVPGSELLVIFQGKLLEDLGCLQGLGSTTIHVVRSMRTADARLLGGLNDIATLSSGLEHAAGNGIISLDDNIASAQNVPPEYRQLFFVFCKHPCGSLQSGKLRVRCAKCKDGCFLIERDPREWDDVLKKNRIGGECKAAGCSGNNAEFYFKCAAHDSVECAVPLDRVRSNYDKKECIACADVSSPVVEFSCNKCHILCLPCFTQYGVYCLNNRSFILHADHGYTLQCPNGCERSLIEEIHHFRLLGNDQYDRYQRYGAEESFVKMGGVFCPQVGCGSGLLPDGDIKDVMCDNCRLRFCRLCLGEPHFGDCSQRSGVSNSRFMLQGSSNEEAAERAAAEMASLNTIELTTKRCPQCNVHTEKNDGCMHMTCSRCQFNWCWLCERQWTRDCQGDHWFG